MSVQGNLASIHVLTLVDPKEKPSWHRVSPSRGFPGKGES